MQPLTIIDLLAKLADEVNVAVEVEIHGGVYYATVERVDLGDETLVVAVDADAAEILTGHDHRVSVGNVQAFEVMV